MKLYQGKLNSYEQDPTRNWDLAPLLKNGGDFLVIPGASYEPAELYALKERKVLIELDEPNRYFYPPEIMRPKEYERAFEKILSICPYSVEWANSRSGMAPREFVFFPTSARRVPAPQEKKYDLIYTGHFLAKTVERIIDAMQPYRACVVSNSNDPRVTHRGVSYEEKMKLVAQSRITMVHNLHFMDRYHMANVREILGWEDHGAFRLVPRKKAMLGSVKLERLVFTGKRFLQKKLGFYDSVEVPVPQIKSRVFEAAFCKSLMLVLRDPFNVIEKFFEPGKEFIYFDFETVHETIRDVLGNYKKYEPVVEAAHERAMQNYTTDIFFERFLSKIP